VHLRRPSFWTYQNIPSLIEGGYIADAVATISSLNIIAGELDA
jgi:NADH-quinone oxidoreductase subunit D